MAETALEKLQRKLAELFQFDQEELDFGIYRIMNQKRDEVRRFLNDELLPQVKEVLGTIQSGDRAELEKQLKDSIAQLTKLGVDPDSAVAVQELKKMLADQPDSTAVEAEVYTHLYNFFNRYYDSGDFISQRRYKEGVYAIPYEGEEVKLYWANHDQYYIKSSEYFRNYSFRLTDGRLVTFKLVEADTEKDNVKAHADKERRFILDTEQPVIDNDGELVIRFVYKPSAAGTKQKDLNHKALTTLLGEAPAIPTNWLPGLRETKPTDKNKSRTILEKYLNDYTERNNRDFFVHKDLGKFLRRELDFYIKGEVLRLDDLVAVESSHDETHKVEQKDYSSSIALARATRQLAEKIIIFLAQLEDYQKKLWLKKKFVVETQYVVTLDRIPMSLQVEALANEKQVQEWQSLNLIPSTTQVSNESGPQGPVWKSRHLPVDTRHFDSTFRSKLVSSLDPVDENLNGLVVRSENFQALGLLGTRYREQVRCIYIDPPYNTDATPIIYKNDYKDSSWLCLIENRLRLSPSYMVPGHHGICIAIDDTELAKLSTFVELDMSSYDLHKVIVNHYPGSGTGRSNVTRTHEYALFLVPSGADVLRGEVAASGWRERGFRRSGTGENNYRTGRPNSFFAVLVDSQTKQIMGFEPPPVGKEYPLGPTQEGWLRIYPTGEDQSERVWSLSYEGVELAWKKGLLKCTDRNVINRLYLDEDRRNLLPSVWIDKRFSAVTHGTNLLKNLFGESGLFSYPKSVFTVELSIEAVTHGDDGAVVLDYFAGSGTTGHAVINLNRRNGSELKYVLVEMGEHFDQVLLPRLKKVCYSSQWNGGYPVASEGSSEITGHSHAFKYIRLESYEDTLNNLVLTRTPDQESTLFGKQDAGATQVTQFREDYMLGYMLDVETRNSPSLLNLQWFERPFAYELNIASTSAGDTQPVVVDVVETFNYLLGLKVQSYDTLTLGRKGEDLAREYTVVQGETLDRDRVLIIWRTMTDDRAQDNAALDEFFRKQQFNPKDREFDLIYVNCDNNLENMRREDETWTVRVTEFEFKRLMFDVRDV